MAVVVTIVVVVLGVAVPLAVGVVNSNDHAKSAPGGVDLNAAEARGRAVFAQVLLDLPHAQGVQRRGQGRAQPRRAASARRALVLDAIAKGRARGQGQMPAGLVDGEDAQDVAAYVAAVAGPRVAQRAADARRGASGREAASLQPLRGRKIVLPVPAAPVRVSAVKTAEFPIFDRAEAREGWGSGGPKVGANRVVRRVAQALSARARQLTP